jgi:hypothetical protein
MDRLTNHLVHETAAQPPSVTEQTPQGVWNAPWPQEERLFSYHIGALLGFRDVSEPTFPSMRHEPHTASFQTHAFKFHSVRIARNAIHIVKRSVAHTLLILWRGTKKVTFCAFWAMRRWPKEVTCLTAGVGGAILLFNMNASAPLNETSRDELTAPLIVAPTWVSVVKPIQTFALTAPEIERLPLTYHVLRHVGLSLMEDRLKVGHYQDGGLHAMLALLRKDGAPTPEADKVYLGRSFYLDLVKVASAQGLGVIRIGPTETQITKFGNVESADVLFSDGAIERTCLAYRHAHTDPSFSFQGWLCSAGEQPLTRPILGCFVDRIGLMSSGEDKRLRRLFADAELRRDAACLQIKLAGSSGRKDHWLDISAKIPLLKSEKAR